MCVGGGHWGARRQHWKAAGEEAAKGGELVTESHEVLVLANILPKTVGGKFLRYAYLNCRSLKTGSLANTLDD